jgi:serine/threonine-protein kinase RsbW
MDAMAHTRTGPRHLAADAAEDDKAGPRPAGAGAAGPAAEQAGTAAELRHRRVRLTREPSAAAHARREVRAAIAAWAVPVDADVAVLLASDLVTSAIVRGEGKTITLSVRCPAGRLRVDVLDTWRALPVLPDAEAGVAAGPGLSLIAAVASEWGTYRTPAGMAVFFTLDPERGLSSSTDESDVTDE